MTVQDYATVTVSAYVAHSGLKAQEVYAFSLLTFSAILRRKEKLAEMH